MDLQSILINWQFTSGIWEEVHDAVYIVLEDQPSSD